MDRGHGPRAERRRVDFEEVRATLDDLMGSGETEQGCWRPLTVVARRGRTAPESHGVQRNAEGHERVHPSLLAGRPEGPRGRVPPVQRRYGSVTARTSGTTASSTSTSTGWWNRSRSTDGAGSPRGGPCPVCSWAKSSESVKPRLVGHGHAPGAPPRPRPHEEVALRPPDSGRTVEAQLDALLDSDGSRRMTLFYGREAAELRADVELRVGRGRIEHRSAGAAAAAAGPAAAPATGGPATTSASSPPPMTSLRDVADGPALSTPSKRGDDRTTFDPQDRSMARGAGAGDVPLPPAPDVRPRRVGTSPRSASLRPRRRLPGPNEFDKEYLV